MNESTTGSIFVNGRFLTQPVTGVQRYAIELLNSLDLLLSAGSLTRIPVTVLIPNSAQTVPSYSFLKVRQVGRLNGQLWEQFELPFFSSRGVLFTPCGGAPISRARQVITIHDAGPFKTPAAYTAAYGLYYRTLQRQLARKAVRLLTVSEFSRRELVEVLKIPSSRVSVIYESGEHIARVQRSPEILAKHRLTAGRYALGVSSANPNKNLIGLAKASTFLASSQIQIAIAGGSNSNIFSSCPSVSDSVKQLGVVSDGELRTLYENAGCFVFPSFYEGFGLPPMEAMTLGCPVIVSRQAALAEIFRESAVYCDPQSPEDIAAKIEQVMRGDHPAREACMSYAAEFTWEKCARETWKVLLGSLLEPHE